MSRPHLAILGAGPVGLEAALAATDRGLPFTVYEAGPAPAANIRDWDHVRLFTPWALDVSPRMRRHLAATGNPAPESDDCPTGAELVDRALAPAARLAAVAPHLALGTRVLAIGRQGLLKHEEIASAERGRRPFRLLVAGPDGRERVERADVVLDCTGTWGQPNWLGDGGIPAPGERAAGERIARRIPDLEREAGDWAGRTLLLAGAGHSAQTAARDLAAFGRRHPATRVIWALRKEQPGWGAVAGDPLAERQRLTAAAAEIADDDPVVEARRGAVVEEVAVNGDLRVTLRHLDGGREELAVDRVLSLTGSVGDASIYRQLQVHECYATCGPMKLSAALLGAGGGDCLEQSGHGVETLENPEPGFFILGAKSYGRNSTFLLRVGWEQVDEVFARLDG